MIKRTSIKPWIIWLPAATFAFYIVFMQTSMSVMIEPVKASFKLDSFGVGLLSASFYYTYSILQVPIGAFIDRFGVRIVIVLSILGSFLSCFFFAYSYTLFWATFARILMGVSGASALACGFYIGAVWFRRGLFSLIVGLTEMAAMLGGAFSTRLLAGSVKTYGWRSTLFFCGVFGVFLFIAAFFFVKNRRENVHSENKAAREIKVIRNLAIVLKSKDAWICGIYSGFLFAPLATIGYLWGVPFIQKSYSLSLEESGSVIAMIFIGAVIGTPLIGVITERVSIRRKVMLYFTIIDLILISLLIYCPIFSVPVLYVIVLLSGFFCTVYVIPFAIIRERLPEHVCGTAMAFANVLCGCIGSMFFQPVTGWILAKTALLSAKSGIIEPTVVSYKYALSIIPACFLIALALIFLIKKEKQ